MQFEVRVRDKNRETKITLGHREDPPIDHSQQAVPTFSAFKQFTPVDPRHVSSAETKKGVVSNAKRLSLILQNCPRRGYLRNNSYHKFSPKTNWQGGRGEGNERNPMTKTHAAPFLVKGVQQFYYAILILRYPPRTAACACSPVSAMPS